MGENYAMLVIVLSALIVAAAILQLISVIGLDVPSLFSGVQ